MEGGFLSHHVPHAIFGKAEGGVPVLWETGLLEWLGPVGEGARGGLAVPCRGLEPGETARDCESARVQERESDRGKERESWRLPARGLTQVISL